VALSIYNDSSRLAISSLISTSYLNMQSSFMRLSSGLRINSAADSPAQLIISEQLRAQIGSLNQEIDNLSAMVGKYETASSYLSSLRSRLTDARTMALAATNEGFNDEAAQAAYNTAAGLTVESYNSMLQTASYNGRVLFDGSEGSLASLSQLEGIDLSSAEAAETSIALVDEAIAEIDSAQVEVGSSQKYDIEARRASLEITMQNLTAAESQIRDLDYAMEYSRLVAEQLRFQVGLSILSQQSFMGNTVLKLFG